MRKGASEGDRASKATLLSRARAEFPDVTGAAFSRAWAEILQGPEFEAFKHPGRRPKKIKQGDE
jgi:hypothetical protein